MKKKKKSVYWWDLINLLGSTSFKGLFLLLSMKYDIVYSGKGRISTVTIITIIIPIAVSVMLVILSYCFLRRRATKKSNAIKGESFKKSDHILNYHGMQVVIHSNHIPFFSFSFWQYQIRAHYQYKLSIHYIPSKM